MPAKTAKNSADAAPTDAISFVDAVREGKEIFAKIEAAKRGLEAAERGQLRLGELAHKVVHPKYRDRTLAKFAKELGIAKCTLERYRNVYRQWAGKLAPGPISVSYAVLRELQKHPKREQIIQAHPNLTKREAHEMMRALTQGKAKGANEKGTGNGKSSNRRWATQLVDLIDNVIDEARIVEQPMTPEQKSELFMAVEPAVLVPKAREASDLLAKLADYFEEHESVERKRPPKEETLAAQAAV
jgi:hypothetical protein